MPLRMQSPHKVSSRKALKMFAVKKIRDKNGTSMTIACEAGDPVAELTSIMGKQFEHCEGMINVAVRVDIRIRELAQPRKLPYVRSSTRRTRTSARRSRRRLRA